REVTVTMGDVAKLRTVSITRHERADFIEVIILIVSKFAESGSQKLRTRFLSFVEPRRIVLAVCRKFYYYGNSVERVIQCQTLAASEVIPVTQRLPESGA